MTPLRQRMLEDMSIRNLAENTQLSYVQQVSLLRPVLRLLARATRARADPRVPGASDEDLQLTPVASASPSPPCASCTRSRSSALGAG